jgi:hypothetical protein
MLFDFLKDIDNYKDRAVARYEGKDFTIDTARVSDGVRPIETAVRHPEYNDGLWIIVDAYDNVDDAQTGHDRWIAIMTSNELPNQLIDCQNAEIGILLGELDAKKLVFNRTPTI